ncbi:MAG: hypothetical protein RIS94_2649 [Pseudomonadota bacterium]|jgi:two-component sensor histidine kinase
MPVSLGGPIGANSLGMALVMSSTMPLVLLDESLVVQAVSGSFCRAFALDPAAVVGRSMLTLGAGEWDIPQLRLLLEGTVAGRAPIDAYEIDLVRKGMGKRRLILNAHLLSLPEGSGVYLVLGASDVTDVRRTERQKDDLVHEKQLLLQELQHRVANSLQIIASVLMQSARRVQSEETRTHLRDAHRRVMSIATLQHQLALSSSDQVAIGPYFKDLCNSIGASMIGDPSEIALIVHADATVTSSAVSVSLGLIVTELVINCLKHAFGARVVGGVITVDYRKDESGWCLSVADNGTGIGGPGDPSKAGLGTGIVNALARQLDAEVTITDNAPGTRVAVSHAGPVVA